MKKQIIEFFKPDRKKILVTLLYPYIFISPIILILFYSVFISLIRGDLDYILRGISLINNYSDNSIIKVIKFAFIFSILSYPFICALFAIYRKKNFSMKSLFSEKVTGLLIILSIMFFNPLFTLVYTSPVSMYTDLLLGSEDRIISKGVKGVSLLEEQASRIYIIRSVSTEEGTMRKQVLDKKIKSDDDYFLYFSQINLGDEVFILAGKYYNYRFEISKSYGGAIIKYGPLDVPKKPTLMVQVELINNNSPFHGTNLLQNHLIYEIGISQEDLRNYKKYRITNSSDFFSLLSSVSPNEYVELKLVGGRSVKILVDKNIADWGIEVKNVEIK